MVTANGIRSTISRVCILCEKLINGRMIDVWQDHDGTYRLHCPTPGCSANTTGLVLLRVQRRASQPKFAQERRSDLEFQFLQQIDSPNSGNVEEAKERDPRAAARSE